MQAIDVQQAARELQPRVLREAELRSGYIEGVLERAPAVMSLNGVVASLAVLELQAWATGLRQAHQQAVFDGATGEARMVRFRQDASCNECRQFLAAGNRAAVVRNYRNA